MAEQTIQCPKCKTEIPLTDAISNKIREELKSELQIEVNKKEQEIAKKQKEISVKEKELADAKNSIDEQVAEKLKSEKKKLEDQLKSKVREELSADMTALQTELDDKNKKLKTARDIELQIRKEKRELEESKAALELEVARKLDEGKRQIEDAVTKKVLEEHRQKDSEKDRLIKELSVQMEDMKRKAEQRSQQLQGESLELELEESLKIEFPFDTFEPVEKGVRGADLLQKVHTQSGKFCGSILWETKRTKLWSDGWVQKLKDDQREAKAEVAVLISEALPKGFNKFRQLDGVWVTDFPSFVSLALALRVMITQVSKAREALAGKSEKMELVYNYLTGNEFRSRVEAIVESVSSMRNELNSEKTALQKIWAKREKQIEKVIGNMVGMYGDLEGISGTSLPSIKILELPSSQETLENKQDKNA